MQSLEETESESKCPEGTGVGRANQNGMFSLIFDCANNCQLPGQAAAITESAPSGETRPAQSSGISGSFDSLQFFVWEVGLCKAQGFCVLN